MADTIVTNTPATNDNGSVGWVVALVVVFVLVVGTIILYQRGAFRASSAVAPAASPTNINVVVPNPAPAATAPAPTSY